MTTRPEPGERWAFSHHGVRFEIDVTELALDGDIVHGKLIAGAVGKPGDLVIVPTASVMSGERRDARETFQCPKCGMVSGHPEDIANNYCGKCHEFVKPYTEEAFDDSV